MDSNEDVVTAKKLADGANSANEYSDDLKYVSQDINGILMHTSENQSNIAGETSASFGNREICETSINLEKEQACDTSSIEVSSNDKMLNINTINSMPCEIKCENKNVCDVKEGSVADNEKISNNQKNNRKSKSSELQTPVVTGALSHLLDYGMSDSEDSESDSVSISDTSDTNSESSEEIEKSKPNNKPDIHETEEFREIDSSSDSSTYYDSDSSSESADNGACAITPVSNNKQKAKKLMAATITRGELTLEDLPPIEQLQISIPEQECVQIGIVSSIVEQLVIVQSLPGLPAYDIDTLLFVDKGVKPLGRIFDVLGPVTEPFYAVRFNSYEQVTDSGIKPGMPVFCAPYNSEHTAYVFVSELMKIKGSDASWKHNNEPPDVFLDYSDDEKEIQARKQRKVQTTSKKTNSLERNKKFEAQMNNKNTLMNQRFNPPSTSRRSEEPKTPHNWSVPQAPRPMRPEFCLPYGYFNPYGNFQSSALPQFGMPPMMGTMQGVMGNMGQGFVGNMFPPFNPHIPPPVMRPQPVSYFPNPRHPRWGLPGPQGNFGNGSQ